MYIYKGYHLTNFNTFETVAAIKIMNIFINLKVSLYSSVILFCPSQPSPPKQPLICNDRIISFSKTLHKWNHAILTDSLSLSLSLFVLVLSFKIITLRFIYAVTYINISFHYCKKYFSVLIQGNLFPIHLLMDIWLFSILAMTNVVLWIFMCRFVKVYTFIFLGKYLAWVIGWSMSHV